MLAHSVEALFGQPPATPGVQRFDATQLPSPKVTAHEKKHSVYPYYAGFSSVFAETALDLLEVEAGSTVFDPWNGAGTTSHMGAVRGAYSTGLDLNPVLTVVARARSASVSDVEHATQVWSDLVSERRVGHRYAIASVAARVFQTAVARAAVSGRPLSRGTKALVLCALFEAVRFHSLSSRSSNPTWFKAGDTEFRLRWRDIVASASYSHARLLSVFSSEYKFARTNPTLAAANFSDIRLRERKYDAVLTSPPYLTRIDYVKATLPELGLVSALRPLQIANLRKQMLGTPLTTSSPVTSRVEWGAAAIRTLGAIRAHPSKASDTYYRNFYVDYFDRLSNGIGKIALAIKPFGKVCIVVQSSHYKEIFIDLPGIVEQMACQHRLRTIDRFDFHNVRSMVNVNSRAPGRGQPTTESALVLRRSW